jgi:two-component system cell cycle sensor histidine kinase/response regulator CckA
MDQKPTYEELERKLKIVAEYTHSWEYWIGPDSTLCYISPSCGNHTGYTQQEFIDNENLFYDIIHPDDKDLIYHHIHDETDAPKVESLEFRIVDRHGCARWISHTCQPVYDERGDFLGRRASNWDITDQKMAEKERDESTKKLKEMSAFLNTVLDAIPDVIGVQDLNHRIIRYNRAGYAFLGMKPSDVHGKKCFELICNKIPCQICATAEVYESKQPAQKEKFVPEIDKWLDVRAYPILDEDGNLFRIIEHLRDISREKNAEIQLKEAHERLITVLNSIEAHIYVADIDSHEILFMNKKMIKDFDADFVGKKCYESFRNEDHPCRICTNHLLLDEYKQFKEGHTWQGKNPVTGRWYINFDRAITWVDGRIVRIEIAMDITEAKENEEQRRRMEQQLQQAQKLEAIGTLAGGIAHDFNNLLMGIQGRASLISVDLDNDHPFREHVEAIMECSRSATELTSQLLGVARGGKYEAKPIRINDVVNGSSTMFGRTKKEIRIHTKLQNQSLVVVADRRQIEQALLNLYINAWQAMPNGGELYLETSVVHLEEADCRPHSIEPGKFVKISVTDTGTGMDEKTRQRVFDPFFTTKKMGRGTGLGLASAYGIVKNHSGAITVLSEEGKGTTFNIYLPYSDYEVKKEITVKNEIVSGTGTILLVDDESVVIDVAKEMLEKLGYDVLTAKSGKDAVETLSNYLNRVNLIILDMIMPGMDGSQTFDLIRDINPSIPVLLSSGYSLNGQANKIMRKGCNGFIQKPFLITQLSKKIGQILDGDWLPETSSEDD